MPWGETGSRNLSESAATKPKAAQRFRWKHQALINTGAIESIPSLSTDELIASQPFQCIAASRPSWHLTRDAYQPVISGAMVPPRRPRAITEGADRATVLSPVGTPGNEFGAW